MAAETRESILESWHSIETQAPWKVEQIAVAELIKQVELQILSLAKV